MSRKVRSSNTRMEQDYILATKISLKEATRNRPINWPGFKVKALHLIQGRLTGNYVKILEDYLVQYAWARFGPTEDGPNSICPRSITNSYQLFGASLVRSKGEEI